MTTALIEALLNHPDDLPIVEDDEVVKCRVCGCSDQDACIHPYHGNCWWVEPDLCSHCKLWPGESFRIN